MKHASEIFEAIYEANRENSYSFIIGEFLKMKISRTTAERYLKKITSSGKI